MTNVVVQNTLTDPSGSPIAGASVTLTFYPNGSVFGVTTGFEVASTISTTTDSTGKWSFSLPPRSEYPLSYYRVVENGKASHLFQIPFGLGPFNLRDIVVASF